MDRGAWQVTVHRTAKESGTTYQLSMHAFGWIVLSGAPNLILRFDYFIILHAWPL